MMGISTSATTKIGGLRYSLLWWGHCSLLLQWVVRCFFLPLRVILVNDSGINIWNYNGYWVLDMFFIFDVVGLAIPRLGFYCTDRTQWPNQLESSTTEFKNSSVKHGNLWLYIFFVSLNSSYSGKTCNPLPEHPYPWNEEPNQSKARKPRQHVPWKYRLGHRFCPTMASCRVNK